MSEDSEIFQVTEETVLTDVDSIQEQRQILPPCQGVRVKIEKPSVRKSLKDNSKEAGKEGPDNPVGFKFLNCQLRVIDGISVPVYDDNGVATGETELRYKNKIIFPSKMDLIFYHNPEVKISNWWATKQYIFGFKGLCKALGFELKEIRVNDMFLEEIKDKEVMVDIIQEADQELKDGEWVDTGTFKNRVKNFRSI